MHGIRIGVDPAAPQWGTLALATTAERVTYRTAWARLSWGDTLLDYWDDFSADGALDERQSTLDNPIGSLAVKTRVPARGFDAEPGLRLGLRPRALRPTHAAHRPKDDRQS